MDYKQYQELVNELRKKSFNWLENTINKKGIIETNEVVVYLYLRIKELEKRINELQAQKK